MKPLMIYVCEDEKIGLDVNKAVLENLLKDRNVKAQITYRNTYNEQDNQLLESTELAILDIDLVGSMFNGIQLARKIRELNPCTVFIFITSHKEFAHDASQIHLSGFLDKPLDPEDFEDALDRAIDQVNGCRIKNSNHNVASFQNNKILLRERNIISIEKLSKTHEVKILTTEGEIRAWDSIKDTERRLSDNFVKVNWSIIVNLAYVFHIEGDSVIMRGGTKYSISLRNRNKVRDAYEEYLSRKFV